MSETSKLGLPFLFAGQAQKELAHNEALQRLDSFLFPLLGEVSGRAPPARPAVGRCYIVPEKATGDWTGADRNLACFSEAGLAIPAALRGPHRCAPSRWRHGLSIYGDNGISAICDRPSEEHPARRRTWCAVKLCPMRPEGALSMSKRAHRWQL